METYRVPPPVTDTTAGQQILRFLFVATVYSTGYFTLCIWSFLHHFQRTKASITASILFGFGLALSNLWFARRARKQPSFSYEIVVTDKKIRGVTPTSLRVIRKGRIRTISERCDGLLVSEHGPIHLFKLGGLWIPKSLREYEHLRTIVESWRVAP
jgi:hypothetical protein